MERVLITGAAGLMGTQTTALLSGRYALHGLDLKAGPADLTWFTGDITDADLVHAAVKGCDAVVHIAAIPNIVSGTAADIMRINVTGTWNVYAAAQAAGAGKVVLCSSDSVVGFTVLAGQMIAPDYLPIDTSHPLRPTDPYALSKKLGEEIARSFTHHGISTVAIRPVFIAHPESRIEIEARARDPDTYVPGSAGGAQPAAGGAVWHHVHPRDVARAFALGLELDMAPGSFEAFFISSAVTLSPEPTLERLQRFLGGDLPPLRDPAIWETSPHAPLYDLRSAAQRLGFVAEFDVRDWT
ncbi:MAG: NAD(P)-dependent oxidoreductase [Pseudomonadota bacterium]